MTAITNPPVLVPPIKSKKSQGRGASSRCSRTRILSMISCNMRSSDKPRIPPPSDRANYEPSIIEYGFSQTHQEITALIREAPEAEAWWGGVRSSDGAPVQLDGLQPPLTTVCHEWIDQGSKCVRFGGSATAFFRRQPSLSAAAPPRDEPRDPRGNTPPILAHRFLLAGLLRRCLVRFVFPGHV